MIRKIVDRLRHGSSGLRCGQCANWFDRHDARAFVSVVHPPLCPVCSLFEFDSGTGTGWALWNDCQGLFSETISPGRAVVDKILRNERFYSQAECIVVPVKTFREPEWRRFRRDRDEREKERFWA